MSPLNILPRSSALAAASDVGSDARKRLEVLVADALARDDAADEAGEMVGEHPRRLVLVGGDGEASRKDDSSNAAVAPTRATRCSSNKTRPNFFVCVKIDEPRVVGNIRALQAALVSFDARLSAALLPPAALHLTLATARCDSAEAVQRLADAIAAAAPRLLREYGDAITLKGVCTFSARGQVVYVAPVEHRRLALLMDALYDAIERAGGSTAGRKAQNKAHVTVAKLPRALARELGFVDEDSWRRAGYGPTSPFGQQRVTAMHLCVTGLGRGHEPTGFYETPRTFLAGPPSDDDDVSSVAGGRRFSSVTS